MQSNLTISDVYISNMYGTTSSARDPNIGTIVCSSPDVCSNIYVENIDVVSPSGTNDFICTNVSQQFTSPACVCRGGVFANG
jgi:galacturan 1,4-alpha-galacturonidase